jgi:hypothetical protein
MVSRPMGRMEMGMGMGMGMAMAMPRICDGEMMGKIENVIIMEHHTAPHPSMYKSSSFGSIAGPCPRPFKVLYIQDE